MPFAPTRVSLADRFGRSRVGITAEGEKLGILLFDDYLKKRIGLFLLKGHVTTIIYGPDEKPICSFLAAEGQGDQPDLISNLLKTRI